MAKTTPILFVLFLIGCAKSSSTGTTAAAPTLYKTWHHAETSTTLVLTANSAVFSTTGAANDCTCQFAITGSETSGTFALSNCQPSSDANCSTLEGSGVSFTCDGSTFTFQGGSGPITYTSN